MQCQCFSLSIITCRSVSFKLTKQGQLTTIKWTKHKPFAPSTYARNTHLEILPHPCHLPFICILFRILHPSTLILPASLTAWITCSLCQNHSCHQWPMHMCLVHIWWVQQDTHAHHPHSLTAQKVHNLRPHPPLWQAINILVGLRLSCIALLLKGLLSRTTITHFHVYLIFAWLLAGTIIKAKWPCPCIKQGLEGSTVDIMSVAAWASFWRRRQVVCSGTLTMMLSLSHLSGREAVNIIEQTVLMGMWDNVYFHGAWLSLKRYHVINSQLFV